MKLSALLRRNNGYQLLSAGSNLDPTPTEAMGKQLGTFRAVYLVVLCSMGSFLFAYDTGIVGGVLTLPSFQRDFRYSKKDKTQVNSNCVSILQAGAFFGCFAIWPITSWLGRRMGLVISSLVFCVGGVLQVINTHSIGVFYAGRVISGFGVGGATVLVPMFSAEMAPKEIRGKLGSCFQLFFATGVCVSYWVDYAVQVGISSKSSSQWQVPVGLQLVPGAMVGLGMLFVKESARWLARKGRDEEALASLTWVRGGVDTPELRAEFAEIQVGIQAEVEATQGVTWKELLLPSNRYRLFIAVTVQLCAQLTGNTSLAYYAPQIFATIGAGNKDLFITGFFGVVKIVGVLTFQIFLVERIGRKKPFMGGAFAMGTFMLIIAIIVATHPPKPLATGIAPSGIAVGAASQWLFNFVMSQITPHAITNIGWRTFLMFAIFNYAIIVYSYFLLKETQGKSLEEMEVVFGTVPHLKIGDGEVQSERIESDTPKSP